MLCLTGMKVFFLNYKAEYSSRLPSNDYIDVEPGIYSLSIKGYSDRSGGRFRVRVWVGVFFRSSPAGREEWFLCKRFRFRTSCSMMPGLWFRKIRATDFMLWYLLGQLVSLLVFKN